MPFVRVRDLDVYYEIHGKGPQVLFITGTGGDLRRRPNMFDGPLVNHFTVLSYDQRGLAQTSTPDVQPNMGDYAADADALLEALEWPRCPVIGVSFGGMVAQEFTLRFPHRVERLVLACTSSGGAGGASYPLHEMDDWPGEERVRRWMEIADSDPTWTSRLPQAAQRLSDSQTTERTRGQRMQLEARRYHDTYERLGELRTPVFVCGGSRDLIAPRANVEALGAEIPGAVTEIFDGGHMFMVQDPRAYPAIIEFLEG